ncbi:MAG TPA: hypothetical protein VHT91_39075 [Kofleriaceae bacterium]|nr:hypothetical protein [Kofleriaceae bacterium]
MMDSTDMTTPVTRGELQEVLSQVKQDYRRDLREATEPLATRAELHQEIQAAIAPLATRAELHQEIQAAIAPLATKAELQVAIAPLATKAELQAAIAPLATKAELQAAIAPLATKAELELWGGALVARMQHNEQRIDRLGEQIQQSEQRFSDRFQQSEQRFLIELARHTSAIHEAMRTEIRACFEPLADLPARMSRVEAAVFGPKRPARRTRRRKN